MKKSDIYTSGWLKAPDLLASGNSQGLDLTIKAIKTAQTDDGNEQRTLSFVEDERQLGLNVTNWESISEITGKDDDDHWAGTVINAYPHKLDRAFNGKTHGIRIQRPQGVGPAKSVETRGGPLSATDARKAAFDAMKAVAAPGASRDVLVQAWTKAIAAMFPGKSQGALTAADWNNLAASFVPYDDIPADNAPIQESDIPF